MEAIELARTIVDAIADKKGENVVLLDIRGLSVLADYFVIGSGTSERQLRAIAEGVEENTRRQHRRRPHRVEGRPEGGWVLMDYGDVVIHLFSPAQRRYYGLERLWNKGKVVLRIQ